MPGGFTWRCPICYKVVSGRSIPGRGLSRANHLRSHGIWTSWLTKEEKKDNRFLKSFYKILMQEKLDYHDSVIKVRREFYK